LLVKHLNALLSDLHHYGFCGYYRIGDNVLAGCL